MGVFPVLRDKTIGSHAHAAVLNPDRPTPATREADADREYAKHRNAVITMLRLQFSERLDYEELYQEAWTELLEVRRRGESIDHPQALLRTIAWRRAADASRRERPEPIDPSSAVLELKADDSMAVADEAGLRLDAEALRMVIDTLEPREAAALKLRFDLHLTGPEIKKALGVSQKVYEQIVSRAYKAVRDQVEPDADGDTHWRRRQRSLLLFCEMGLASPAQLEHARKMLARDPRCRAMLRSMRTQLRQVAAVLPMPPSAFAIEKKRGPFGAMADWAEHATGTVRHALPGGAGGGAASGPLAEQAGTGIVGTTIGVGGAAKVIAVCLAMGGTAAVCVRSVLPDTAVTSRPKAVTTHRAAAPPKAKPVRTSVPVVTPSGVQPTTGKRVRPTHAQMMALAAKSARRQDVPVSSPAATPAPSPAPVGSTEFGPGSSGSAPISPSPAPAPANGGGEFGP